MSSRQLISILNETLRGVGKRPPPGLDGAGHHIHEAAEAHEGVSVDDARAWCLEWASDPGTRSLSVRSWALFVTAKRNGGQWGRRGTTRMQAPAPRSAFHEETVPVTAEDFINTELADVG